MKILRRYGTSPAERGSTTGQTCPDILQLDNGDFLVIGKTPRVARITARELAQHGASIGPDEQAVVVPGEVLRAAARDIVSQPAHDDGPTVRECADADRVWPLQQEGE